MPRIKHCVDFSAATKYQLASRDSNKYDARIVYYGRKCRFCGQPFIQWADLMPNGTVSSYNEVPKEELHEWIKPGGKIEREQSKPEPQLMSEYSYKAGRPADIAIYYHNTIELAQRFCKKA